MAREAPVAANRRRADDSPQRHRDGPPFVHEAGSGSLVRALRGEHSCETKPIPAKRPAMQSNWAFPFFRLLSFLSDITSSVAAEGRARPPGSLWQGFVRNKANSARAKRETSPLWKRSYDELAPRPAPPNKANSLDRGPLAVPTRPGDSRSCETKPISSGPAKACSGPGEGTYDQGDERGRSSYVGGRAGPLIYRGLECRYNSVFWSWSHPKVWF